MLKKKELLESIDAEQIRLMGEHQSVTGYHKRYVTGKYDGLNWIKHQIQSAAFDAPEMEHINAYLAREGLIKHQEAEVQRLRAALCEFEEENRKLREDIERIIEILKNGQQAHWQTFKIRQLLGVNGE